MFAYSTRGSPICFLLRHSNRIPKAECEALVALYDSTNGPGWTNKTGWLVTNTLWSRQGLTCSNSQVSSLSLGVNKLSGPIPPELGGLRTCTTKLNGNQLTGAIPAESGNLAKLTGLDLRYNKLAGSIPTKLGDLAALQDLRLDSNKLTGPIPPTLGNLTGLQSLGLSNNQLTTPSRRNWRTWPCWRTSTCTAIN